MHQVWKVVSLGWKRRCPSGWGVHWDEHGDSISISIRDNGEIRVGEHVEEASTGLLMIGALLAALDGDSAK